MTSRVSRLPDTADLVYTVYYESRKRNLKTRLTYEYRCDERLKGKVEGSTLLVYTRWSGGLEHLKIETRLIDEMFASEMGNVVYYNGESESSREEMRWCRCYEGQRAEA